MLKWLYRGIVGVLLVLAVGAWLFNAIRTTFITSEKIRYQGGDLVCGPYLNSLSFSADESSNYYFPGVDVSHVTRTDWSISPGRRITATTVTLEPESIALNSTVFLFLILMYPLVNRVRRRLLERRRESAGRCRSCDYSLTGIESGVCPECGIAARHAIEAKSTT